ncbi:MAG TPA: hypothetical protein VK427_19710 [Kofleriaceae bacterium]|nr:hypothetical protein [Kofleriaceae bacterium]
MLVLAGLYGAGWSVRRDFGESQRWLRMAAKRGSGVAHEMLEEVSTE